MTSGGAHVACSVDIEVAEPATVAVQVAAARRDGSPEPGSYVATVNGAPRPMTELDTPAGGRIHHALVTPGRFRITYDAAIAAAGPGPTGAVGPHERLLYLRPSRYCPSDDMNGWVRGELGGIDGSRQRVDAIVARASARIAYEPGSSTGTDDARHTLLTGHGVCRDFAHLVITLCRALDVPARMVAVYAPGLWPMDFHAVVEVCIDDTW